MPDKIYQSPLLITSRAFLMTNLLHHKHIREATLLVHHQDALCLEASKGSMTSETPFYLASVSKLYTHAIIFRLLDNGQLQYDTRLADCLPESTTRYFPHAERITLRHLLDHTSGLPNHETDRDAKGNTLLDELLQHDRSVSFAEILARQAQLPACEPGGNKARYADLNALLLGKMAESATGKSAQTLLHEFICQPLALAHTHWVQDNENTAPIYNGQAILSCQQYLSGQSYPGGIIASNRELMRFTRAFFAGTLFSPEHIRAPDFRPIQFYPLQYGSGMMRLTLAKPVAWFFGIHEIRGHSGITGSFAFYCPEKEILATGSVNQLRYRPYTLICRAIRQCTKHLATIA